MAGTTRGKKKKKSGFFTLSRHPVLVRVVGTFRGDWTVLDSPLCPAAAFATTHSQRFASSFWVSVS